MRKVGRFAVKETPLFVAAVSTILVFVLGGSLATAGMSSASLLVSFLWLFLVILGAAFGVVRHAEVLAHKYGEPYGTLILTLSVIGIEVIMIATMMLNGDPDPTAARDTMYSVIMIVINGLIGLALILGGLRHGEQSHNLKSSNSYFSMILAIVGLGLVLPAFVPAHRLVHYEVLLIVLSFGLYAVFLRVQTKEHRYFFVAESGAPTTDSHSPGDLVFAGWMHALLLIGTLALLVLLAKSLAQVIDIGSDRLGAPPGVDALIVALLVLSPEGLAAIRAGRRNDMQHVVNICLGSVLATVALTIPTVLLVSFAVGHTLNLGLNPIQAVLVAVTLLVGMNTYRLGETNLLQGVIHFALFAAFVTMIFV
jgi:Ca2+:H+ antiporter